MPFIDYKGTGEKRIHETTLSLIELAKPICREYEKQGFKLTLRQLYYQFVARGLIENNQSQYDMLGKAVNTGRLCGLLDWDWIEDRGRNVVKNPHWVNPKHILDNSVDWYAEDKWSNQDYRIEVWVEKDALSGVIDGVCNELDVPYLACRGYVSQSEAWACGRRFRMFNLKGQSPVILHFGDHDPSGIDMTRDNRERLEMFAECEVTVERLALNWDQIQKYNPPPNPTKMSDSRARGYVEEFGKESWELDALEPKVIAELVRKNILKYRDERKWKARVKEQEAQRELLRDFVETYEG